MQLTFERLQAWQKARNLVKEVYLLIKNFPDSERYALSDQVRRAVISVPSNLADGSGRLANKEKIHFCHIAYGSLMEVMCQLTLAYDLEYITSDQYQQIRNSIEETARIILGYHTYLKNEESKKR